MSQKAALAIGMRAAAESSEIDFLEFDSPDAKKYVSHNKGVKRILNEFTKIRESGILLRTQYPWSVMTLT